MRRSPRLRSPPPRAPPRAPSPPPPPPMVAPAAGDEQEQEPEPEQEQEPEPEQEQEEFVICNDDGFVYKVPSGLYTDAAPSSTQSAAAGPDPVAAGLRRRRRALLRLRDKRLRQLSRWEALASELLAPLPAPLPPAPEAPPASPPPVAASASVLDDLLAQADLQAELLKRASQLCDEVNALCDAHEAAMVDGIATLPVWGDQLELMASLQSPDRQTDPGTSGLDEGNRGFQSLDSQQGERAIGVASAAVERVISGDKRIQSEVGDELPRPVLTENRKRKEALIPSSSNSVAAVEPLKSKRQKASGSKSTTQGTPGSTTRRKAANTQRAPDTSRSPGPTTRRRAAAQIVSPCSS